MNKCYSYCVNTSMWTKNWDVNADNLIILLILPKITGYVKTFEDKGGDKNKNNKLMFLHIDDKKLLGKYKTTLTKFEDLKIIELHTLPVYDTHIYIYIYIYIYIIYI